MGRRPTRRQHSSCTSSSSSSSAGRSRRQGTGWAASNGCRATSPPRPCPASRSRRSGRRRSARPLPPQRHSWAGSSSRRRARARRALLARPPPRCCRAAARARGRRRRGPARPRCWLRRRIAGTACTARMTIMCSSIPRSPPTPRPAATRPAALRPRRAAPPAARPLRAAWPARGMRMPAGKVSSCVSRQAWPAAMCMPNVGLYYWRQSQVAGPAAFQPLPAPHCSSISLPCFPKNCR